MALPLESARKIALLKFASLRSVFVRIERSIVAPLRSAPTRSADVRFVPCRIAPGRPTAPKFAKLKAKDVHVGRGRAAAEARAPYIAALKAGSAGRVELERGEKAAVVKRRLQEASRQEGIKIRSSCESPRSLVWKRTGK